MHTAGSTDRVFREVKDAEKGVMYTAGSTDRVFREVKDAEKGVLSLNMIEI